MVNVIDKKLTSRCVFGASLIEVIISLGILTLGLASAMVTLMQSINGSHYIQQTQLLVQSIANLNEQLYVVQNRALVTTWQATIQRQLPKWSITIRSQTPWVVITATQKSHQFKSEATYVFSLLLMDFP